VSTWTSGLIIASVTVTAVCALIPQIRHARRHNALLQARSQHIQEASTHPALTVWDLTAERWIHLEPGTQPAPGQLTRDQLTAADQLDLLYLSPAFGEGIATVDDSLDRLFTRLGPPTRDLGLNTGCDQLRDAIRDEQQKGDRP